MPPPKRLSAGTANATKTRNLDFRSELVEKPRACTRRFDGVERQLRNPSCSSCSRCSRSKKVAARKLEFSKIRGARRAANFVANSERDLQKVTGVRPPVVGKHGHGFASAGGSSLLELWKIENSKGVGSSPPFKALFNAAVARCRSGYATVCNQ